MGLKFKIGDKVTIANTKEFPHFNQFTWTVVDRIPGNNDMPNLYKLYSAECFINLNSYWIFETQLKLISDTINIF